MSSSYANAIERLSKHICYPSLVGFQYRLGMDLTMKKTVPLLAIFCLLRMDVICAAADLSEYFLRDPYSQLDLFRQSTQRHKQSSKNGEKVLKSETMPEVNDDEYFDYLYEIGMAAEEAKPKLQEERKIPTVNADVLANVKKPSSSRSKYQFRHKDNIAMESKSRPTVARPTKKKTVQTRRVDEDERKTLQGFENVKRLIPSSLQTVIEDSGKRIVKAVMEPIDDLNPRGTLIQESSFMNGMFDRYRTYIGYMAPTLAPEHVTTYLAAQWISTLAITVAWVGVGTLYSSVARSDDARSSPEPWEDLVPDSRTLSKVFKDLSEVASRWHDEL